MDDIVGEVRKLVDSLSPRTAHQYKSYNDKYIQWLRDKKIIGADVEVAVLYKELPLSARLIHWFLLETLLPAVGSGDDDEGDFKIATLKKFVSSLKFLSKLCAVHGNAAQIDEKYLESVIRLHSHWNSVGRESLVPLVNVSVNLWNGRTGALSEKFFKTCLEKSRFLVDFHFRFMTNLPYDQRSKIKLCHLKPGADAQSLSLDFKVWSSLQVYLPESKPQIKSRMPMVLLPHSCPFFCPLTSLATYLYLRFYGVKTMTKGDGFPNLVSKANAKDSWLEMPLIRGKSLSDYPREETLSNYYSAVFRYCQLPYKRREFFNKTPLEFPTWPNQEFVQFFESYPQALESAFVDSVPTDFREIMNYKVTRSKNNSNAGVQLPEGLLVQIFPEIEAYKRQWESLSTDAKDFIELMQTLRKKLLSSLPIIFKLFPNHDLFKDPIFENADFQAYFRDVIGSTLQDYSADPLPGFQILTEKDLQDLLIEPPSGNRPTNTNELATTDLASAPADIMKDTFQFVQYQTLTNFQILISLLSKIFDKLEMKKSSREFMIHQLNLLLDTITEKINVSRPADVENYVKKEEESQRIGKNKQIGVHADRRQNQNGLLAIEDESSDDDEEEDGDDMQEELKFMINELVGERVRSTVNQQMEQWESKMQSMIDAAVESKLKNVMKRKFDADNVDDSLLKRQRLSMTPSITKNESTPEAIAPVDQKTLFELSPDLETVEAVILEWFTPNPDMNNECVHHMNKTHDKSWRSSFEKLYKERKVIVEFYIYLVNEKGFDRYKAVEICESLKEKTDDKKLRSFAQMLKDWKRVHENSFGGILD